MQTRRGGSSVATTSKLSKSFVENMELLNGDALELIGAYSFRNGQTGRIVSASTPALERAWLRRTENRIAQARFLHTGLNGYQFKKIRENDRLVQYRYKLPFKVGVDRLTLDIERMVADFLAKAGLASHTKLRLMAQYKDEDDCLQWASETYLTGHQLMNMARPLFTGDKGDGSGAEFLSDLYELRIQAVKPRTALGSGYGSNYGSGYGSCYGSDYGSGLASFDELPLWLQNVPRSSNAIKVFLNPHDDLCFQRVCVYHMNKSKRKDYMKIDRNTWFNDARKLGEDLHCPGAMSEVEIQIFCDAHEEYGVTVFADMQTVKFQLYPERPRTVYALYTETVTEKGHYSVVIDPSRFHNRVKFCNRCARFIPNNTFKVHKCQHISEACLSCGQRFATDALLKAHKALEVVQCEICHFDCYGQECLCLHAAHECNKRFHKCQQCDCKVDLLRLNGQPHVCHTNKICQQCHTQYDRKLGHRCWLMKRKPTNDSRYRYFCFDFETRVDNGPHEVIAVAFVEIGAPNAAIQYYAGEDCLRTFVRSINDIQKKLRKHCVWVAHNGSAYDFLLLQPMLHLEFGKHPEVHESGSKIMYMHFPRRISFVDSCLHIKARLDQLQDVFDFRVKLDKNVIHCGRKSFTPEEDLSELRVKLCYEEAATFEIIYQDLQQQNNGDKKYYPYRYYAPGTVSKMPSVDYFDFTSMSTEQFEAFVKWYEQRKKKMWDFDSELKAYCILDVEILNRAMASYMRFGKQLTNGLNPLCCPTIAGYAKKVYMTFHIPTQRPDTNKSVLCVLTPEEDEFIRRSVYGGRVNVTNHLVELTDEMLKMGHSIQYKDIISLYPYIQMVKPMPVGAPRHYTHEQIRQFQQQKQLDNNAWLLQCGEGFVQIKMQLGEELYPPMPTKHQGRVNWTLLPIENNVYALPEVREAIRAGGVVTKIDYALLFDSSLDLWRKYISLFYEVKTLAGKRPKNIDAFCETARSRFGFNLDPSKFHENPGLKNTGKNLLNSLWGKMMQRSFPQKKICNNEQFDNLLQQHERKEIVILSEEIVSDNQTCVKFRSTVDDNLGDKNIAVASYVTSWARLEIRSYMKRVGDHKILCDTDSVLYSAYKSPGALHEEPWVAPGLQLGDMEDEKAGYLIYGAVSPANKLYALKCCHAGHELPEFCNKTMKTFALSCLREPLFRIAALKNKILEYVDVTVQTIKCKGVSLKVAANNEKLRFKIFKKMVCDKQLIVGNLRGPKMKRRRVDPTCVAITTDDIMLKSIRFTADKYRPIKPEFEHLYTNGFLLPIGHSHAVDDSDFT